MGPGDRFAAMAALPLKRLPAPARRGAAVGYARLLNTRQADVRFLAAAVVWIVATWKSRRSLRRSAALNERRPGHVVERLLAGGVFGNCRPVAALHRLDPGATKRSAGLLLFCVGCMERAHFSVGANTPESKKH